MPSFLPPERAQFFVQANGLPVALLTVDSDELAQIDAPTLSADTAPSTSPVPGWSVLPQPTMTIVDGPRGAGFLIPAADPTATQWVDAAVSVAGAFVMFSPPAGNGAPADDVPPGSRGGFVRLAQ